MRESTIDIVIIGFIIIGLFSIYTNNIELASVALGAIAGFLSREAIKDDGDGR